VVKKNQDQGNIMVLAVAIVAVVAIVILMNNQSDENFSGESILRPSSSQPSTNPSQSNDLTLPSSLLPCESHEYPGVIVPLSIITGCFDPQCVDSGACDGCDGNMINCRRCGKCMKFCCVTETRDETKCRDNGGVGGFQRVGGLD
jgi:hypothetical protein